MVQRGGLVPLETLNSGNIFYCDLPGFPPDEPYALIELNPMCVVIKLNSSDEYCGTCIFGKSASVRKSGRSLPHERLELYTDVAKKQLKKFGNL